MPFQQLVSMRLASLVAGAGLIAFAGCSSTAATTLPVTHPTMIEVAPEDFLGDVPCASSGPGLKRYVATLFDLNRTSGGFGGEGGEGGEASSAGGQANSPGGAGPEQFQLPSSAPTPCLAAVGFGFVVPGRHYRVEIDGYDIGDLTPRASGARQMVSPAPTDTSPVTPLVAPRWSATCDRAIAVDSTIIRADQCQPFGAADPATPGALRVPVGSLLGNLRCGSQPGEVAALNVSVDAGGAVLTQSLACSKKAVALFSDLPSHAHVAVYVTAQVAGGDPAVPLAGATCDGYILPDASVDAECSPLSDLGTLRVDVPGALALLSLGCNATDLTQVQVRVPADKTPQSFAPPACLQPFDQGFAAGTAVVTVTALKAGAELGSLTCHAEVAPGKLVTAVCEPNTAK
ncbi:MAG TPA: hypothetical protein VNG33_20080 [Polyangiaceae bacterium]|nr:hypothetical protein [Polyangiaceae bacterium]